MNRKNLRHFFCGLLMGAGGMYWYVVSSEDTLDWVMGGLQRAADDKNGSDKARGERTA